MNTWHFPEATPVRSITPEDSHRFNAAKGAVAGEDDTTVEDGRREWFRWSTRVGELSAE